MPSLREIRVEASHWNPVLLPGFWCHGPPRPLAPLALVVDTLLYSDVSIVEAAHRCLSRVKLRARVLEVNVGFGEFSSGLGHVIPHVAILRMFARHRVRASTLNLRFAAIIEYDDARIAIRELEMRAFAFALARVVGASAPPTVVEETYGFSESFNRGDEGDRSDVLKPLSGRRISAR